MFVFGGDRKGGRLEGLRVVWFYEFSGGGRLRFGVIFNSVF